MRDRGICSLASMLRNNSAIDTINVGDNKISDVDVSALFENIDACNTTLRSINLGRNNISHVGAKQIAQYLVHTNKKNTKTQLHYY